MQLCALLSTGMRLIPSVLSLRLPNLLPIPFLSSADQIGFPPARFVFPSVAHPATGHRIWASPGICESNCCVPSSSDVIITGDQCGVLVLHLMALPAVGQ